ncbi:MAG: TatD family hydrolase [Pseudomonadota bacterium]
MAPLLTDSICHLDFPEFDSDRSDVLASCASAGVMQIVVPAVAQSSWHRTIQICQINSAPVTLLLALGLHPMMIDSHQPDHLIELDELIESAKPIAVGEIGLDFHKSLNHSAASHEKQGIFFEKQLLIAKKHSKPVILHIRKAHDEAIDILRESKITGGIVHAFNGSIQQAQHYIELGFCLSFGGMLTYVRSTKLQRLISQIPIENIVLETDAPDMTVFSHQGQRNSPAYLPYVLDAVAKHKSLDPDRVAEQTTANISRVLGLPLVAPS